MTASGIAVRPAGIESASMLAELHAAAFARSAAEIWSTASVRALLSAAGVVALIAVREVDERPLGLAVARQAADQAEILALGVLAPVRRLGIANTLMNGLLALLAAAGAHRISLEVAVNNHPARRLYTNLGFVEVGRRKAYYRRAQKSPVDALVLALPTTATPVPVGGATA